MFSNHYRRARIHLNVHFKRPTERNISHLHRDQSCTICHPAERSTPQFDSFFEWYHTEYRGAISYTRYTQQYFEELEFSEGDAIWVTLIDLIFSIRYVITPAISFEALQQEIWNAYSITQGFQLDPHFVIYPYSETSFLTPRESEESSEKSEESLLLELDFDIYQEDL